MQTDELVSEIEKERFQLLALEENLRNFKQELCCNPFEESLEYLHIEFNNTYNILTRNVGYCKENGLSIEVIQNEARLDMLITILRSIPLVFVPKELIETLNLKEEDE